MQVDFVFTFDDLEILINEVLQAGAWIVPNAKYATDQYAEIRDVESAMKEFGRTKSAFLLHSSFAKVPLRMRRLAKSNLFYIVPKDGGPAVDLMCAGLVHKNGQKVLGTGFVAIYETFWNQELDRNENVPESLRTFFDFIVDAIRKRSDIAKTKARSYYVGTHAKAELASGTPSVALAGVMADSRN